MKKKVGWSMLQYEMVIPLEQQKLFEAITNEPLNIGEKKYVKLLIDGQLYDAYFRNEGFNRERYDHPDIVMLKYGVEVRKKLQTIFADSYNKMLEINKTLPPRAHMPEINTEEYFILSATSDPNVFAIECVTQSETSAVREKIKRIPEELFESVDFEPIFDKSAGYRISKTVRKVRKLDNEIGNSLKRLYDFHCQMTGEKIGNNYNALVVEAHHIVPFTESMNNDTSNIIILSPSYHRIIHKAKPEWLPEEKAFKFPNGLVERIKINRHL